VTSCMPLMLGRFVPPRVTSRPLAITEVSRAAEGGVVWGREVACGAVSGKSLARIPAWSSMARTPAPSSRQPSTTSDRHLRCIAVLGKWFEARVERDGGVHPYDKVSHSRESSWRRRLPSGAGQALGPVGGLAGHASGAMLPRLLARLVAFVVRLSCVATRTPCASVDDRPGQAAWANDYGLGRQNAHPPAGSS
jgi:hypothetical protein